MSNPTSNTSCKQIFFYIRSKSFRQNIKKCREDVQTQNETLELIQIFTSFHNLINFFILKQFIDNFCQMAQYSLNSHNSMSQRQKENIHSQGKSKLAINILKPNNENKISEKLALSQALHEEYEITSLGSNTKREKKVENYIAQGRMKLRDYLFLAKTSASKNANEKKKVLSSAYENNLNQKSQMGDTKISKSELRKNKYGIKNSEMFKILKQQMDKEIQESLQEISNIKCSLSRQLMQHSIPSNGQMVMMYNLRSLIKDKLKKSIDQMKELISVQGRSGQEERVQMEIDIDEEFRGDFKLTAQAYTKKYLEMTNRKKTNSDYQI